MPPVTTPKKVSEVSEIKSHDHISINFLLNNPPNDDFAGRFPTHQTRAEESEYSDGSVPPDQAFAPEVSGCYGGPSTYDAFLGADMSFDSFFDNLEHLSFGAPLTHTHSPGLTNGRGEYSNIFSGLEPRANEIKDRLRIAAATLDNLHGTQSLKDLDSTIELIIPSEIEACVDLFFRYYHRHCPILHRPSFCPLIVPLPLLLAVMALGGMYYKDPDKVAWIRTLLSLIEAYIYGLPGLRDEYEGDLDLSQAANDDVLCQQFQTFQGAYLIIVAQYFSGSITARWRVRQQRFSRVLTVRLAYRLYLQRQANPLSFRLRAPSICQLLNISPLYPSPMNTRSSVGYGKSPISGAKVLFRTIPAINEFYRTMNVLLLLDSAFGIFDNIQPRIDLCELDLQLPCDSIYFETANYQEMAITLLFPPQKMKLLDAYQRLFIEPNGDSGCSDTSEKSSLNCWDLLVLIHRRCSCLFPIMSHRPMIAAPF
jgi:hypothetical protein